MLGSMSDRGPDSAGIAVYGRATEGQTKITVRAESSAALAGLADRLRAALPGAAIAARERDTHMILVVPDAQADAAEAFLRAAPGIDLFARGRRIELYKEVGLPRSVAARFRVSDMHGTHAIGHTRMATESAVTTRGAHPFSTGVDQCLVHNGSLSNHAGLRRELIREGLRFGTENDTEVAAGYLSWRMRQGLTLGQALEASLRDLDGFYTFVVGTETGFGVLRDPIACKPAVLAETDGYVAFGSEYRALARLPGIRQARVWEPEPARVYFWDRKEQPAELAAAA
jgi:amidophosphoribosyltransferase